MEVATNGAPAPDAGIATPAPAVVNDGPLTIAQAAEQVAKRRSQEQTQATPQPETTDKPAPQRGQDGKFARTETESAPVQGQDAAPGETPPSGEDAGADPAEVPPIEPPRSWTAEQREKFASLPREAQEIIADRENARDAELRRTQNVTAEERKAAEAQRKAADQERAKAEQATVQAANLLSAEFLRDFADIKTQEDVIKLANEDPFRYSQYHARREALTQVVAQHQQLQHERQTAEVKAFNDYAAEQDKAFTDKFKDFADPTKAEKARDQVMKYLTDKVGLDRQALTELWGTKTFRDAKMQQIVYDAARFSAAQEKAKAATAVPKPPVQRPGTGSTQTASQSTIKALESAFAAAKTPQQQIAAAAALRAAKRAAGG
jgi:hypothetical protein